MANWQQFNFYTIDFDYIEYLYHFDKEVYYSKSYKNKTKPYVGIIVNLEKNDDTTSFLIPLTSAKEKHAKLRRYSDSHFLIYEELKNEKYIKNKTIIKHCANNKNIHILAVLDIKKMIPVLQNSYREIEISRNPNKKYARLLEKEYKFCKKNRKKILKAAQNIYNKQQYSKNISKGHCDFKLLEEKMREWEKMSELERRQVHITGENYKPKGRQK